MSSDTDKVAEALGLFASRRWWFRLLNKLCGGHVRNWRR